jgi:type II secretory pathway pseudopilin PulG
MSPVVIVLVVVVILGVIALIAFNPLLKKKEDAAIDAVKQRFGSKERKLIETRATAMGTEPEEAGGVRGMSVLAVNDDELVAVTWSGLDEWAVARSAITAVDSSADDPEAVQKATILVTYSTGDGSATASFRLKDPVPWLTELGYDWGPEGPPAPEDD